MARDQLHESKKYLTVFNTTGDEVGYHDSVVFSYLAWQDAKYQTHPNQSQMSRATGVSPNTIPECLKRLSQKGLFDGEWVAYPENIWELFRRKPGSRGTSVYDRAVGWTLYVRNAAHPDAISVIDAGVYSYLIHCAHTKHVAKCGFTDFRLR